MIRRVFLDIMLMRTEMVRRFCPPRHGLKDGVLVAVAVALSAYLGLILTEETSRIASIWVANAIVLAVLLLRPRTEWAWFLCCGFIGNLGANLWHGDPWIVALPLGLCNVVEIVSGAWFFRRLAPDAAGNISHLGNLLKFTAICAVAAPLLSAALAATYLSAISAAGFPQVFTVWFMADMLGILAVAPMLIAAGTAREIGADRTASPKEFVAIATLSIMVAALVFFQNRYPLLFLAIPAVVIPAFRLGFTQEAAITFLVSALAVLGTALGYGPLHLIPNADMGEKILTLQTFVVTANLSALMVSATVTDRRRAEFATRMAGEQLRTILNEIPAMVAYWDRNLKNQFSNAAYKRLVGWPLDKPIEGKKVDAVIGKTMFEENEPAMRKALEGTAQSFEREMQFDNGPRRFMQVHYIPERSETEVTGFYVLVFDITPLKLAEAGLIAAKNAAEESTRSKSDFLASMSHELRTPLNSIIGFSDLLLTDRFGTINDKQREFIGTVQYSANHLLNLIHDILEFSRIESDNMRVELLPISLRAAIRSGIALSSGAAMRRGIRINDNNAGAGIRNVIADRVRLNQVIVNLLSNAIKYNREGGQVDISTQMLPNGRVRLLIRDTGRGIAEQYHSAIFEPFNRAGAEKGTVEGSGLGLAVSKKLVTLMGGEIGFESDEHTGSTFWIDLVTTDEQVQKAMPGEDAARGKSKLSLSRNLTILHVEDNPTNRQLVRSYAATVEKLHLIEAATAEEAVECLSTITPDLLMVDIDLPGRDGFYVLTTLRANPDLAKTPCIAISASSLPEDAQRALQAGFVQYLVKPLRLEVFEDLLARLDRQDWTLYRSHSLPDR